VTVLPTGEVILNGELAALPVTPTAEAVSVIPVCGLLVNITLLKVAIPFTAETV